MQNDTNEYMEDELLRVFHSMDEIQREVYVEQGKAIINIRNKYNAEQINSTENS